MGPTPTTMRAMMFTGPGRPLEPREVAVPQPGPGQILIRVATCAVCRTDLHIVDGELAGPKADLIPGHEIIGTVEALGPSVPAIFAPGERVGVPWLAETCGRCGYCRSGRENLCPSAKFTGYTVDGGFAEYTVANARFCFKIPDRYSDEGAAPLMCAGLIGYRAYAKAGSAQRLGLYGFGAAAHILCQLAVGQGREVYAFTRPGDDKGQAFARRLGAIWAGGSDEAAPVPLDAALIFAPVGALVPKALADVAPGGLVVCAGIHMSDIPAFPYSLLWGERTVVSVANLTREDGLAFLDHAGRMAIRTATRRYRLDAANEALQDLRAGRFDGAAVLQIGTD